MEGFMVSFMFCFEETCIRHKAIDYLQARKEVFSRKDPTVGRLIAAYGLYDGYWERIRRVD